MGTSPEWSDAGSIPVRGFKMSETDDPLSSVAIRESTKSKLDDLKNHDSESYQSVISRLVQGESGDDRAELIEDIRSQLERLDDDYERPENDPVDYAEIETRVERVVERMLR